MNVVKITNDVKSFNVFWHLTDFCNFSCSYCPEYLRSGVYARGVAPGAPTNEEILAFLDRLDSGTVLNGVPLRLVLTGGEPTVHPMFKDIVDRCSKHGYVSVNTNGSRPLNWWKSLPTLPSNVNISLHHAETKITKINELARFLLDNQVQVRFNLVCDPANWAASQSLFTELDEQLKSIVMAWPLHDPDTKNGSKNMLDYSEEQLEWMRIQNRRLSNHRLVYGTKYVDDKIVVHFDNGSKQFLRQITEPVFKFNGWNKFIDWECSAGQNSFIITFDGTVWSSICKAELLGRINDFKLRTQPLICSRMQCVNPHDLALEKRNKASHKNTS